MTIDVLPLECVVGAGSAPHVCQEVLELRPAFADPDAAATIVLEVGLFSITTTREHCSPGSVLWRPSAFSMGLVGFAGALSMETATRLRGAIEKVVG